MKKQEWNEGLNHVDPDIVEEYALQKDKLREKKRVKNFWLRVGALAACIFLVVTTIIIVPKLLKEGSDDLYPPIEPPIQNPSDGTSAPGLYQTTFQFDSYNEMISAFGDTGSADTIQS